MASQTVAAPDAWLPCVRLSSKGKHCIGLHSPSNVEGVIHTKMGGEPVAGYLSQQARSPPSTRYHTALGAIFERTSPLETSARYPVRRWPDAKSVTKESYVCW